MKTAIITFNATTSEVNLSGWCFIVYFTWVVIVSKYYFDYFNYFGYYLFSQLAIITIIITLIAESKIIISNLYYLISIV
jgi:hypothetical protein